MVWTEKFTVDKALIQIQVVGELPRRLLPVRDHARLLDGHVAPEHLPSVDDVQIIGRHHGSGTPNELKRFKVKRFFWTWPELKTGKAVVLASVIVDAPHVCPVEQRHFPVLDGMVRGPDQIAVQGRIVRGRVWMRGRP